MLAVRGLVVDRENGNIFKPDRYGFPGRARHGLTNIDRAQVAELYQRERTRLSTRRYAWIDSLFALPEAVLYAVLVDYFDRTRRRAKPDYTTLWEHIRECIDLAHRDGSIKAIVSARAPRLRRARRRAGRDAAQVPLVGEAAVPAHQLGVGLHRAGDELPARRRRGGLPVVAQLLRRDRRSAPASRSSSPRSARSSSSTHEGEPADAEPVGRPVPARPHLLGRQHQGVPGARARQRRPRAVRRRPHLRRHAALAEVVELAHGDGAAGAGARGHDVRPAARRAGARSTGWTPSSSTSTPS